MFNLLALASLRTQVKIYIYALQFVRDVKAEVQVILKVLFFYHSKNKIIFKIII